MCTVFLNGCLNFRHEDSSWKARLSGIGVQDEHYQTCHFRQTIHSDFEAKDTTQLWKKYIEHIE